MKRIVYPALLCALLLVITACHPSAPTAARADEASPVPSESALGSYQTVAPDAVKQLLDAGASFTLVDVRRADEYSEAHIPTAIHIANETIGEDRPEALPELNAPIIVYCRSGRRSREAAEKLLALGYTDVRDLGGIQSWPYPTVTGVEPGVWPNAQQAVPDGILSRFHTADLNGNPVDASMLADHALTMVNVWATYCGPCLSEMPDLGELAAEYRDRQVQIVGLVSDVHNADGSLSEKQLQTARDIVSATHADYPHLVPSPELFGLLSQITAVPTTFFVDRNGRQVGYAYLGAMAKDEWRAIIAETLAEVAP